MRPLAPWFLALALMPALVAAPKPKPRPKAPTAAQLQAQIKALTGERDELKERVAALEPLQQELAGAQRGRDLAKEEAAGARRELETLKAGLRENQSSGDVLLRDLQQARTDLASAKEDNGRLRRELGLLNAKVAGQVGEGALLPITPDVVPARPMNLKRVTPSVKKVDRGVVVVNVLVNEQGEVLDTRLLQGLPGDGEWVQKANDACVEAARRLVFDPARTKDGVRIRVWQGVGFLLD